MPASYRQDQLGPSRKLGVRLGGPARTRGVPPSAVSVVPHPFWDLVVMAFKTVPGLVLSAIRHKVMFRSLKRFDTFPWRRGRAPCRARADRECGNGPPSTAASARTGRAASSR